MRVIFTCCGEMQLVGETGRGRKLEAHNQTRRWGPDKAEVTGGNQKEGSGQVGLLWGRRKTKGDFHEGRMEWD